jgi:cell division protein FtsQ
VSSGPITVAGRRAVVPRAVGRRTFARLRSLAPSLSPRLRRRLLVAAGLLLLMAAVYQLWLRDSTLVAVKRVTVTGATTGESPRLRAALVSAARTMTTLHVDQGRLERAVEAYPVVRGLEVSTDFPHTLRIEVLEYHPDAIAVTDSGRVPVAGDGTVLRGLPSSARLPTIEAHGGVSGDRLVGRAALDAAEVAGGAPAALRSRLRDVLSRKDDGIVVRMREGPDLIFGDTARLRDKWIAAARVLADPAARGASYLDLRLPGRPAAGGLPATTVTPAAPAGSLTPTSPAPATAPTPAAPAQATPTPDPSQPAQAAPIPPPTQTPLATQASPDTQAAVPGGAGHPPNSSPNTQP